MESQVGGDAHSRCPRYEEPDFTSSEHEKTDRAAGESFWRVGMLADGKEQAARRSLLSVRGAEPLLAEVLQGVVFDQLEQGLVDGFVMRALELEAEAVALFLEQRG